MTFEEFCESHNVTIRDVQPIARRKPEIEEGDSGWEYDMQSSHFRLSLFSGEKQIWRGEFSFGCARAEDWAKRNKNKVNGGWQVRDLLNNPLPFGRAHYADSKYRQEIKEAFGKRMAYVWNVDPDTKPQGAKTDILRDRKCVTPSEILQCLAMDAMGADQRFEYWAGDYGLSEDSIKAKEIYESCRAIRFDLMDGLGGAYETLAECEE